MAEWTLAEVRKKVRQVTGRLNPQELTNEQVDEYINKFYQFVFPAELKLEKKHTFYEFLTAANQASYDLPNTATATVPAFTNFEPPGRIDELNILWYQDPAAFQEANPRKIARTTLGTGDEATVAFTTTVQSFPILPDSLVITDDTETFEDTNTDFDASPVTITGDLGGTATVNYSTGAVSVTFNTAPASGQNIALSYIQFQPGLPTAVLLYDDKFTFFPVPNTAYRFKVKAYAVVAPLVNATDKPELEQWGPCLAYGAARDIHSDMGEMDAYAEVTALYKEQLAYVLKRTNQNLLNSRAQPNF